MIHDFLSKYKQETRFLSRKKNRLAISGKHEKRLKIVFSYRIQNWFFWCVFHKRIFLFYFSVGAVRSGGFRDGITDRIEWNVMVNMSQTFSSQSGFFGTDDIVKRIFSDTFLDRSHPCRSIFFAIGWHSAMKNKKYTMHSRNWNWKASRCLKITEKVSFNITSEAIYVYILLRLHCWMRLFLWFSITVETEERKPDALYFMLVSEFERFW